MLIDNGVVTVESEEWSPKLSFDYQFTDTIMGYVQLATGFRGGGFSPRPANALQLTSFQPEFIDSFEVGVKTDWLDRRLRFNGDVYYMVNTDKQQAIADLRAVRADARELVPDREHRRVAQLGRRGRDPRRAVDNLRIDFSLGYQNYKVTDLGTVDRHLHHGAGHDRRPVDSRRRACTRRARRNGTWGSACSTSSKSAAAARR